MIPVSAKYRQQIIKDNRNYLIKAEVRLADNTAFELKNEDIWEQGVVFDDASSSNDSFDIGTAIVNELKIVIDNITGKYDLYDFTNGRLVLWMGLEGDLNENDEQVYYRKGFYVIDDPSYNGSLITINCLDNMTWFIAGLIFRLLAIQRRFSLYWLYVITLESLWELLNFLMALILSQYTKSPCRNLQKTMSTAARSFNMLHKNAAVMQRSILLDS